MADIFISYAREDAVRAHALADALAGLGWSVWWDDSIRAGAPFDQVIDEQLDLAACVVVLWSTASVASNWVRAEASTAEDQGKLVPVSFEHDLRLPVRFRQLKAAHLTSTDLREPGTGTGQLLADIAALTGKQPSGIEQSRLDLQNRPRSSGANAVTTGTWRITYRMQLPRPPLLGRRRLGTHATVDLTLHPNGTVTGTGRSGASRSTLAGRWLFDPAGQILHLEISSSLQAGTTNIPVEIVQWNSTRDADCTFGRRPGHLEKLPPAGR